MECQIYNLEYYENLLRIHSKTAQEISKIRWDFVVQCNPVTVLDYGCGCGFFRAYRPKAVLVDTFDIGGYPQTGITRDRYDLVCFWDVLEHFASCKYILSCLTDVKYVALSIPILPDGMELETWKHYKPGEHLQYFTHESLSDIFRKFDFIKIKEGQPECPPRKDVWNFLYAKINH